MRRRQQDAGRRLQRNLPDPRRLDLHGRAERLQHERRLRRRHPRRDRGVRRQATRPAATAARRTARPSRPATSAAFPDGPAFPPAATARRSAARRATTATWRTATAARPPARSSPARLATRRARASARRRSAATARRKGPRAATAEQQRRAVPGGQGPGGADCKGPNGLFFGDATGCSKTCTKEPACRTSAGVTGACAVTCGNGNVETGEECDDGNLDPKDGCGPDCKVEGGFTCDNMPQDDTATCMETGNGTAVPPAADHLS